jgi:hypothetical protein
MVHARDVERDRADIVVGRPEPHTRPLAHARPVGEPKNGRVAMAREICSPKPASCRKFSAMYARKGALKTTKEYARCHKPNSIA